MNQVSIRKIANGYIVSALPGPASIPPTLSSVETYCPDLPAVCALLTQYFEPAQEAQSE